MIIKKNGNAKDTSCKDVLLFFGMNDKTGCRGCEDAMQ